MSQRSESLIKAQSKYADNNPVVRIDKDVYNKLKSCADEDNCSIKDIIKESLNQYINIDEKTLDRLKKFSDISHRPITDIINMAINQYIDKMIGL